MDIEHYDLCVFDYIFDRTYSIILISYILHQFSQAERLHYINKGKPEILPQQWHKSGCNTV